jgi:hypothetical protein
VSRRYGGQYHAFIPRRIVNDRSGSKPEPNGRMSGSLRCGHWAASCRAQRLQQRRGPLSRLAPSRETCAYDGGPVATAQSRALARTETPDDDSSFLRDGALANFLSRRRQQAHYDRDLIWLLDQQFYQLKPATNQLELVIVKRPALSILSILCLRGHGALLSFAGRARASFLFTQRWQNAC